MNLNNTIQYLSFLSDGEDFTARYAVYTLSGVLVREKWANDADMTDDGETLVYFFPSRSVCCNVRGEEAPLPRAKYGDCVRLTAADGSQRVLRVRQASYYDGGSFGLSHVRLRLK